MAELAKKKLTRASLKRNTVDENTNAATNMADASRASISSASLSVENSRYSTPITSVPTTPAAVEDKDALRITRRTSGRISGPSTTTSLPPSKSMSHRLPLTNDNEEEEDIIPVTSTARRTPGSFKGPTRQSSRSQSKRLSYAYDSEEDDDLDNSADAQLARQLQAEEVAKVDRMANGIDMNDGIMDDQAQASTSIGFRKSSRKSSVKISYTDTFADLDSDDSLFDAMPPAKRSKVSDSKSKITKTTISDSEAEEPFTSDLPTHKKFKQPPKIGKLFGSEIPNSMDADDFSDFEPLANKKRDKGKGKQVVPDSEEEFSEFEASDMSVLSDLESDEFDDEAVNSDAAMDMSAPPKKGKGKAAPPEIFDNEGRKTVKARRPPYGMQALASSSKAKIASSSPEEAKKILKELAMPKENEDWITKHVESDEDANFYGLSDTEGKPVSDKAKTKKPKKPKRRPGESRHDFAARKRQYTREMIKWKKAEQGATFTKHCSHEETEQCTYDCDYSSNEEDTDIESLRLRYRGMGREERFQAMFERRARKNRQKLERNHPSLKTMWLDLERATKIPPVKAPQPKNITRTLKPFQLEGLNWMMEMEKTQWGGGLLGDEMGMGKTIQAVSLIMSDYPQPKPSLVLIPPVAMMQWQEEIAQYTNGVLKTFVYHGTNKDSKNKTAKDLQKYDVVLMSYNSLESIHRFQEKGRKRKNAITGDMDTVYQKSPIHAISWHRVILDEAHNIKTRTTGAARACFALNASHKWCLSGTPLQNRIGEFFSLIRFLNVQPFGSYFCRNCKCDSTEWNMDESNRCKSCKHNGIHHVSVFNQELLNPIQKHGNDGPGAEAFKKLRLLTDRFMLRRVKTEHSSAMELPAKEIYVDRHFFGEEENDFAASIMGQSTRKFETYVAQGVLLNNYANVFGLIMQMRQVADHPDLILKKDGAGGQNVVVCCICDEAAEDAVRSGCKHDFCRSCVKSYITSCTKSNTEPECPRCHLGLAIDLEQPELVQDSSEVKKSSIINRINMAQWTSSSKIEALLYELHLLRSKNSSSKSIIFSSFTTMLQLIEWRLRRAGITTVMLDGSMTPAQRQASISAFMSDPSIECFLVSLKAGGVALNLTEASRVFLVDPWWNPAAEWQSADRCHRIGQCRPCTITRLCIEDSVESRMVLLQEKKTNMIKSTVEGSKEAMESLTPEDMQFLFRGS